MNEPINPGVFESADSIAKIITPARPAKTGRRELSKDRRAFLSEHPTKQEAWCGHKRDFSRLPKTNCITCWDYFFINQPKFTEAIAAVFDAGNGNAVIAAHGRKFFNHATRFLAAVHHANVAAQEEVNIA